MDGIVVESSNHLCIVGTTASNEYRPRSSGKDDLACLSALVAERADRTHSDLDCRIVSKKDLQTSFLW